MANINPNSVSHPKRSLVIGNNTYSRTKARLHHYIHDADDLSMLLNAIGFRVKTHHDLTNQQLIETVYDFSKTIVDGDLVLFYLTGHAYAIDGENYFNAYRR